MIVCADSAVSEIEKRIADRVGPQRFNVWFKNATQFTLTDGFLRIGVPNRYVGDWIESHFSEQILEIAREVTGQELVEVRKEEERILHFLVRKTN